LVRDARARSGRFNVRAIAGELLHGTSVGQDLLFRFAGGATEQSREYTVRLPEGYPASAIRVRLSVPNLPPRPALGFSDHVIDADGNPTNTVLAVMTGGFAVSQDLGKTWDLVKVRDRRFRRYQFVHVKSIGQSEILAQAVAERWHPGAPHLIDNLVL